MNLHKLLRCQALGEDVGLLEASVNLQKQYSGSHINVTLEEVVFHSNMLSTRSHLDSGDHRDGTIVVFKDSAVMISSNSRRKGISLRIA
jgi:hypothetical protein